VVTHTCNSSTWEERQEDHEFEANLDYTARPFQKHRRTKQINHPPKQGVYINKHVTGKEKYIEL
jgi:hypothetical protein